METKNMTGYAPQSIGFESMMPKAKATAREAAISKFLRKRKTLSRSGI